MKEILQSIFVFKMLEQGYRTKGESENNFDVWYDTDGSSFSIYQSLISYWEFFYDNADIVSRWRFDLAIWQMITPRDENGKIADILFYDGVAYVKTNTRLMDYVEQLLQQEEC